MILNDLLEKFKTYSKQEAIIWHDQVFTYEWLINAIQNWKKKLANHQISPGEIVEIDGDYSPKTIALLFALIDLNCIIVPISPQSQQKAASFREIAQVESDVIIDDQENISYTKYKLTVNHPILLKLKNLHHPGLILFSSGSTGESKAAVHDWTLLLEKYRKPGPSRRIIVFLLFDHIGGVNTLLHTLSNGGCVVILKERTPQSVCEAIQNYQVQVLPTSPTFLNLLLFSHAYEKYDLKSLELITYGTEVMPESLLHKLHQVFPTIRLLQTYGLSEIGILKTKSESSDSVFIKIVNDDDKIRIRGGMLEVKACAAMLGYLNAESPFTEDGWFKTGDMVETHGDYIHILGRASEIINVGGSKIYPAEVENVLEQMNNVADVIVNGDPNPITGQIVKAMVKLIQPENLQNFRQRMREFCKDKLEDFAIPQRIIFVEDIPYGERFKKMRKSQPIKGG